VAARRRASQAPLAPSPDGPVGLMWVFAVPCAAIVIASLVTYANSASQAHADHVAQLRREASLKAGMVQGWMERRLQEGRQIAADPTLRASVLRWRRHADEAAGSALRHQLQMLLAAGHYTSAVLVDEQARALLGADEGAPALDRGLAADAAAALRRGAVASSDLVADAGDADSLHFDLFVPLLGADGRPDVLLLLRTDPRRLLLPQLLAGSGIDAPETLLLSPRAEDLLVIGLGGSDMPVPRTAEAADGEPTLATLAADGAASSTSLVAGLARGDEAMAAVAQRLPGSNWSVAVQIPQRTLRADGIATGLLSLFLCN